jgi:site-specific DNA-methyltransferase (adenine-specific)
VLSFGSRELGDGIKYGKCKPTTEGVQNPQGRWPANLIHDGSDEVTRLFPVTTSGAARNGDRGKRPGGFGNIGADKGDPRPCGEMYGDTGSAARFFYCAKASAAERQGSRHPTIKPLDLMRYLVRLVTPPGGTVLDPFCGSGTTLVAARREGFDAIGIDLDPQSVADAQRRCALPWEPEAARTDDIQPSLFEGGDE